MNDTGLHVSTKIEIKDVGELPATEQLPERLQEAAVLYRELGTEWFDSLSRNAPVLRKNGYQLPTLMLFFLALFSGEFRPSIKHVCETLARPKNRLLAAVGGFKRFPTQASVSRFLKQTCLARLEEKMSWMLVFSHEAMRQLLNHAGCASLDSFGEPWQLFDLDPTATVLRQRALAEHEELPPPQRTNEALAAPGYGGRKRGDVLFRRTVLQHSGSSVWLGSWLRRGGQGSRETFAAAIDTVVACCRFANFDSSRAILRVDGEGGNVPTISACIKAGIAFVMRGTHYSLLERPDIRQQLLTGRWYEVNDSGSGPKRVAIDLGQVKLTAGATTVDDQGRPYEAVTVRVVVSRFEASEKCSSGVLIDGALYEVFVTNLPEDAWPAHDVVTLYYHRTTQENRLGREDKELALDTVFSQSPQGQALVTLVGLLVWNLRVLLGFRVAATDIDAEPVTQTLSRQDRRAPAPNGNGFKVVGEYTLEASDSDVSEPPMEDLSPDSAHQAMVKAQRQLWARINEATARLSDESLLQASDGIRCLEGHLYNPLRIRELAGHQYLVMQIQNQVCGTCSQRHLCTRSTDPRFRKERAIQLEIPDAAEDLQTLIEVHRNTQTKAAIDERRRSSQKTRIKSPLSTQRIEPDFITHIPADAGSRQILFPRVNPAALKRAFARAVFALSITVESAPEPPTPQPNIYTYRSPADRARRRRTWSERLSYNRSKAATHITVLRAPVAAELFRAP